MNQQNAELDVLVVGLGFGRDFVPIYQAHPAVSNVGVVEPNPEALAEIGDRFDVTDRWTSLDEALQGDRWDAVHILSPVKFHHEQVLQVLESGRHCASAVPMATSLADCEDIIAAEESSGRNYMMMETSVFSREFFLVKELLDTGRLGRISFGTGEHLQNLDGYPHYWLGYPPMRCITHALSPILELADARVTQVRCLGSAELHPDRVGDYGPGFGVETGLFGLESSSRELAYETLTARITMSFFQLGRSFYEGFNLYGDRGGIEWPQVDGQPMKFFEMGVAKPEWRGRPVEVIDLEPPHRNDLLPASLAQFQDGHHGGSHPHLVHEFISSIVEGRKPKVHARVAASWTAPGICAHESALRGGEAVEVPNY